ncbi:RDD family protein [Stackebrandtia endophytica]|uniref:RDD family protein n=1 Tax=Stackebrandtia endophytica TaxID=1496996 RepID=A0A543AVN4_9ACTN|nr:RDD family protein [Stackebrandtia endophytica]
MPVRRWCARLIDWVLPWSVSAALWIITVDNVKVVVSMRAGDLVGTGFLDLVLGQWGTLGADAETALAGVWSTIVLWVALTLTVQVLIVALYDVLGHALLGRTIGKMVTSIKVVPSRGERRRVGVARLSVRASVTVVLPGMAWVLLIVAALRLDLIMFLLGVVALTGSVVECLMLRPGHWGRTCWHDRISGTAVVPQQWMSRLRNVDMTAVTQFNQRVAERGRTLAQQGWNAPATQRAAEQARTVAQRVNRSEVTAKAREHGQQAAQRARRSRLGQAIEKRVKGDG